jgi:hypothetical protein
VVVRYQHGRREERRRRLTGQYPAQADDPAGDASEGADVIHTLGWRVDLDADLMYGHIALSRKQPGRSK